MDFDFSMLSDEDFDRAQQALWDEQIKRWVVAESAGGDDDDV